MQSHTLTHNVTYTAYAIIYTSLLRLPVMNTTVYNKRHVRITLELDVYNDFEPTDFNFEDLLALEGDERCEVAVKEYSDIDIPLYSM